MHNAPGLGNIPEGGYKAASNIFIFYNAKRQSANRTLFLSHGSNYIQNVGLRQYGSVLISTGFIIANSNRQPYH